MHGFVQVPVDLSTNFAGAGDGVLAGVGLVATALQKAQVEQRVDTERMVHALEELRGAHEGDKDVQIGTLGSLQRAELSLGEVKRHPLGRSAYLFVGRGAVSFPAPSL